jgi:hypothetical protein
MPINFNEVEIGAVLVNPLRGQGLDKDSAGGTRACAHS